MADNDLAISAYELKEVRINDEILRARPTEWDEVDENGLGQNRYGRSICATQWETSCPNCGNLVSFGKDDVHGGIYIICFECNAGKGVVDHDNATRRRDEILQEQELEFQRFILEQEIVDLKLEGSSIFRDPIKHGRLVIKLGDDAGI